MKLTSTFAGLAGLDLVSAALNVDFSSAESIKSAAQSVAKEMLTYYHGEEPGQTLGILPGPPASGTGEYYWWEAGAMWGTLIDYWHYTGDDSFNGMVTRAMLAQAAPPQNSFMPSNWTASLGNDDQGFWGMSAMLAAEVNFPNPPSNQAQWLALAQAVFNTQAAPDRHDDTCNGGLRWQIFPANPGYTYKNTIANGIYFNLGARLARYTENDTYAAEAEKTWNWLWGVGLIDKDYAVYDGAGVGNNCTQLDKTQYSYNAAVLLQGAAFMYNHTGNDFWRTHIDGLLAHIIQDFFENGIAVEPSCEQDDPAKFNCNTDMQTFRGYMHRWMASTSQLAPWTQAKIMPLLQTSTAAAVKTCTGGNSGQACGFRWRTQQYDGLTGAGEEMNVVGALSSLLVGIVAGPYTNTTGGTSAGDYGAGESFRPHQFAPITTADRAGAGILTLIVLAALVAGVLWINTEANEHSLGPMLGHHEKRGMLSAR